MPSIIDARGKTTTVSEGGGGVDKFVSAYLEYPCGGTAGVTTGLTASTPEVLTGFKSVFLSILPTVQAQR